MSTTTTHSPGTTHNAGFPPAPPEAHQRADGYTLSQIETAINVWRNRHQSGTDSALCREARQLVKPYTLAFLAHREFIPASELDVWRLRFFWTQIWGKTAVQEWSFGC